MQYAHVESAYHGANVYVNNGENDIEEDGACHIHAIPGSLYKEIGAQHAQMVPSGSSYGFTQKHESTGNNDTIETPSESNKAILLKEYKLKAEKEHERKRKYLFTQSDNVQGRPESQPRQRPRHTEYKSIELRERSFKGFKSNSIYPVAIFAKAGFFFKGFSDIVGCFYCGVTHKGWKLHDDPIKMHISLKQECPYVIELTNDGIFTSKDLNHENDSEMAEVTAATNNMSVSPTVPANPNITSTKTSSDQRLKCKVCLSNQLEVTVRPCGHFAMCQSCSQRLLSNNMGCPVCRGPILATIPTYF